MLTSHTPKNTTEAFSGRVFEALDFTTASPEQEPELALHYKTVYHPDGRITKEILFKKFPESGKE